MRETRAAVYLRLAPTVLSSYCAFASRLDDLQEFRGLTLTDMIDTLRYLGLEEDERKTFIVNPVFDADIIERCSSV